MKIPFAYTWRSLWTRRLTTGLTLCGIALVSFVFASVLMLAHGVERAMIDTGSDQNAILMRKGANSELVSQIDRDAASILKTYPQVATLPNGKPVASQEIMVIINLRKYGTNAMGNITVRGVSPEVMNLRPQVSLTAGRMFQFGTNEIIVGTSIAKRFQGTELGNTLRFGDATWTIVGSMASGGTAFESEIWGDVEQLGPAFGRPVFSSATVRMTGSDRLDEMINRMAGDPRMQIYSLKRETAFYREQSGMMATFIRVLGLIVTIIFSIGAVIGAMITMYAAVANRTAEIGTMRALGFRRRSILTAFLVESLLLALIGGTAGLGLATLMSSVQISTTNFGTFSELAFGFVMSPEIVISTLVFALGMGLTGGFLPSARAARLNILTALRSA
jgi:ABC-type lipoprotein release transport system permease subunit